MQASSINCFDKYKDKFKNAKLNNTPVLIESRDQKDRHSDVVTVVSVFNRYVLLKSVDLGVPYTLNYADLFSGENFNTLKVVFEGDAVDIGI